MRDLMLLVVLETFHVFAMEESSKETDKRVQQASIKQQLEKTKKEQEEKKLSASEHERQVIKNSSFDGVGECIIL